MHKEAPMRFVRLAPIGLLVAGCTSTVVRQERDAQFVGKPEAELARVTRVVGTPVQAREAGGMPCLTYQDWQKETMPENPFCFAPAPSCGGAGFPPPSLATLVCNSTFMVSDGVVRGYSVSGDGCG
jgi:hypothetical protein